MNNKLETILPWLTILLLGVLLLFLYDRYANKYLKTIEDFVLFDQAEVIDAVFTDRFANKIPTGNLRVVYFWQNNCPCNANVLPHFKEMIAEYTPQSVDFFIADLSKNTRPKKSEVGETSGLQFVDAQIVSEIRPLIKYTPAVAMWDQNQQLSYYGPHNIGFVCNGDTSFVKKTLDSLLAGITMSNTNTAGESCFCEVEQEL
jgi:hypothetical protein